MSSPKAYLSWLTTLYSLDTGNGSPKLCTAARSSGTRTNHDLFHQPPPLSRPLHLPAGWHNFAQPCALVRKFVRTCAYSDIDVTVPQWMRMLKLAMFFTILHDVDIHVILSLHWMGRSGFIGNGL